MSTPPLAASGMAAGPFGGPQAQQAAREVNTASLCRIGQETVQDIVYRTMEIFQLLRNMQLPNGVTYHTGTYQDRLTKLQDHLRQLSVLFRKLRLVYDKCNENCGGMDPVPVEKLKQKNQQLKQIMDQLRNLIWDINAMLAMRN
ncbi:mediator of RNA polymerase II transcription subunit 30 isoform X3 [Ochotona curzoniae]|uniref:mediator of RNA polymerase II transcription subunit 30 isoform X3 n=1 Tax=Ochotona curzoniae TaxID=130825 RepID=UPI00032ADE07|nr:mediator of RNA polymerase II transcription subunit 30 isoform X3 [Ochotona curzoniae]